MKSILKTPCSAGLLAALVLSAPAQAATVIETFDTAFPGTAIDGWSGGWVITTGTSTTLNATVNDTSQLAGGGNYLSASLSATGTNSATVNRAFTQASSGIDTTAAYQITFDYRLDQDLTTGQQVFIYAAPGSSSITSSSVSWSIIGNATNGWRINNGNKNGGVTAQIGTNVNVTTGIVYSFTIYVDPSTKTWDVSISSSAGNYANTGDAFGFRTAASDMLSPTLSFGGTPGNVVGTSLEFSIDSVSISQIPEPAGVSLALAGCGMLAAITARRRRGR